MTFASAPPAATSSEFVFVWDGLVFREIALFALCVLSVSVLCCSAQVAMGAP